MRPIASSSLALLISGWSAVALGPSALAQTDVAKSKDHPLLTRFPGSHIAEYARTFDAVDFAVGTAPDGSARRERVEGETTVIHYFYNSVDKQASPLQLIRNYQNAIKSIGGEVVYERLARDTDGGETTLRATMGGKVIWVLVEPGIFSAPTQSYKLKFVEVGAMQQVVSANKMLEEINKNGFVALYINFDTGKSVLKADGQATVKEIAAMLRAAPSLKLSIEGHTDNVGQPTANKQLSQERAQSVVNAVAASGIAAARLASAGHGADRPVADNRSEEGRAKNRRVELVRR
jgi:outer membrane protein OmpA-like peptidoglycan-associated protein